MLLLVVRALQAALLKSASLSRSAFYSALKLILAFPRLLTILLRRAIACLCFRRIGIALARGS